MSISFVASTFDPARKLWMYAPGVDEVNVSNDNGAEIARAIGLEIEDGCIDAVPIPDFVSRCRTFLRATLDKPSPEIAASVSRGPGATVIDCGRDEGYLQHRVRELIQLAQDGAAAGATHVYRA